MFMHVKDNWNEYIIIKIQIIESTNIIKKLND